MPPYSLRSQLGSGVRRLLLSAGLVLLLDGAFLALFKPTFQNPDDPSMMLAAAGVISPTGPSEYLVWTNVSVGLLLKRLYQRWPHIAWYGLLLIGSQFAAHVAVCVALCRRRLDLWTAAVFSQFWATIGLFFLIELQYTSTAFLVCVAGCALLLAELWCTRTGEGAKFGIVNSACGAALLLLGATIRVQMFLLTAGVFTPLVVGALLRRPVPRCWKVVLSFAVFAAVGIVLLQAYDVWYYRRDTMWRTYGDRHAAAQRIFDANNVKYEEIPTDTLRAVQWSENDFRMVKAWFLVDDELFSVERLRQVTASAKVLRLKRPAVVLSDALKMVYNILQHPVVPYVFLAGFLVLCVRCPSGRGSGVVLASAGIAAGALGWLAFLNRYPVRVFVPVLVGPVVVLLLIGAWHSLPARMWPSVSWRVLRFRTAMLVACVVAVDAYLVSLLFHKSHEVVQMNQRLRADFQNLQAQPNELFVVWGTSIPLQHVLPLEGCDYFGPDRFLFIGSCSPQFYEGLERSGIPDFFEALLTQANVYLISRDYQNELLRTYYQEHFGTNVRFEERFAGRTFSAYRLAASMRDAAGPDASALRRGRNGP